MKKYYVIVLLLMLVGLQFCNSGKKAQGAKPVAEVKTNFEDNVKPIVVAKCAPCHTTGNKSHIAEFGEAKAEIDDIISRISKNPGERGFMPARHDKLSDSAIAVFVKWKTDGLIEKAM